MKIAALQNLSATTLQLVINQFFAAVIFYVLSIGLNKAAFGQVNLALAVLMSAVNILSFGIDQLTIKKVAQGGNVQQVVGLYLGHTLIAGIIFYGLLALGYTIFNPPPVYSLILWIGAGKLLLFFSAPFKQACSGMEKFGLLAKMSVVSNIARASGLLALLLLHALSINTIIITFISGDVLELACTLYLFHRDTRYPLGVSFNIARYRSLLREAMPQLGVVLITSALARFDWLYIGFMVSDVKLAEYSFAYKIFEISTLPLLAVSPLLIPMFTRYFSADEQSDGRLKLLIRLEFIVAAFTAMLLNISWEPVVNLLTHGKYGSVNAGTVFILSFCLPLLYLNNFLWTIFFAKGQLKLIFYAFVITLVINVGFNIILIPLLGNAGAAISYLASCMAQSIFLLHKNRVNEIKGAFYVMLICTFCAVAAGFFARWMPINNVLKIALAIVIYPVLLMATMQFRRRDVYALERILYKV